MVKAWLSFVLLNFLSIDLTNAVLHLRPIRNIVGRGNEIACVTVDDYSAHRLQDGRDDRPLSLIHYEKKDACKPMPTPSGIEKFTYMLAVYSSNCKLKKMVKNAHGAGARSLMVVANLTEHPLRLDIGKDAKNVSVIIIAFIIYDRLWDATRKMSGIKLQLLSSPSQPQEIYSLAVILIIAVCTFIVGMLFSVHSHLKFDLVDINLTSQNEVPNEKSNFCKENDFSCFVCFWMVCLVTFILLLYFFYDILVWVMIFLICLLMTLSFYILVAEIIVRLSSPSSTDRWRCKLCGEAETGVNDIRSLVIFPICAIPPIMLIVFRKTRYIWILQDVCCIALSIVSIRLTRFPNLKYIVILGVWLFVYDIFMVYITPLFVSPTPRTDSFDNPIFHADKQLRSKRSTDERISVMEAVATGSAGKSGITLPLVLLFPKFDADGRWITTKNNTCYMISNTWLLGVGDIIAPGMVAAFAHHCDFYLQNPTRRLTWLYSVVVVTGYIIGFVLISVIFYMTQAAQPALFTLLPCTVCPFMIVACMRKEFRTLWQGSGPLKPKSCEKIMKEEISEKTSLQYSKPFVSDAS